jgi:anti-sigma regulatory factor (Ser/Thr protein kinase)
VVRKSLVLNADLHAPARAREWARAHVAARAADRADDTLLIVSELVTNAVRHAGTDVVLSIVTGTDRVRIEVSDGVDDPPRIATGTPDGSRPNGRGLVIVSAVASVWGVDTMPDRPGKTVWADVAL